MNRLFATTVTNAKPRDRDYKLTDGDGLFLLVRPNGSKLWRMNYKYLGRSRTLAFGAWPAVSLADARAKRDEARRQIAAGLDPSHEKKLEQARAAISEDNSFKLVAEEWVEKNKREGMADITLAKIRWLLDKAYPRIGTRAVSKITAQEVLLWRFKYTMHGKQKRIALGAYPTVGLAEARRKRDEAKLKIHEGTDPLAERKRHKLVGKFKASNRFGDLAEEYIAMVTKEGRSGATIEKTKWLLEKLRPIADTPVADLQAVDLFAVLKKIEAQGHFETARRCCSFASRVFRYAAASGRADSDPTTLLRGALIAPRPKHHAALVEPEEVGAFLRALDGYSGYPITLLACKILPHVMARPGELRLARWAEFDFEKAVWTVPPERMKMRRPHYVPLSRQVIALLEELRPYVGGEDYVFPAFHTWKRPLSENTMNAAYRRMGYGPRDLTSHGFRATASSLLNQCGKWNPDAIERSLAHADGNQIRRIYNRTPYWDERVRMHQWWSDYLDALRSDDEAAISALLED